MKCAVITPIGPGHQHRYAGCRESIEAAWEQGAGRFDALELLPMWDCEGQHGRSSRRNDGIARARELGCEWIFFLDADDLMVADAFQRVAPLLDGHDAVWGAIWEIPPEGGAPAPRPGQPAQIDGFDALLRTDPALSLQMGHFVRAEVAAAVGFDPDLDVGEDFKYYLALWSSRRCVKLDAPLFINVRGRHSTGPRAADGGQWRAAAQAQILRALAGRDLIAEVACDGVAARFAIADPFDTVQSAQCRGQFFEQGELTELRRWVPAGAAIGEIGANVGNHLVFYAQHMDPARLYPVEPNPASLTLLHRNVALNRIDGLIDPRGLGVAVGRAAGRAALALPEAHNLGAARLVAGDTVPVCRLDALFADTRLDFLKIDVEGCEIDALEGAAGLIERCRPAIYIEIWNDNLWPFESWCRRNGYQGRWMVTYVNAVNFFIAPE
ncbi:MAG: hypothetical protein RLZZ501_2211 [Pseudomonadota bacterium]|jgi:FkbM family methyltransferase